MAHATHSNAHPSTHRCVQETIHIMPHCIQYHLPHLAYMR